jgi:3-deoxy-manno-octulosonate cytidylyltransferase (CMP-KDO synthetase)
MKIADRVIIATDREEVAEVVRAAGAEVVLTSPEHPSGTDRVAEVSRQSGFKPYDVVINVQGDEPFISSKAVEGARDIVGSGRFPLGTAAVSAGRQILDSATVVKVVTADDGRAMYFSRAPIPFLRDAADLELVETQVKQHVGIYAYTRDALATWVALPTHPLERIERLEQLRPLAAGMAMGVATIDGSPAVGVDTEEDLVRANAQWNDFIAGRI